MKEQPLILLRRSFYAGKVISKLPNAKAIELLKETRPKTMKEIADNIKKQFIKTQEKLKKR